jgi:hypothetical protein
MPIHRIGTFCACVLFLAIPLTTHAALIDRGNGLIYDTDFNITWLANANLAATNTFGVSGINALGYMDWNTAQSWIGAMNSADYLGYNDWRLPTTLQPDASCMDQTSDKSFGYNCQGSEMGHLFYNELGGKVGTKISATHNANYNLFQDLQTNFYWSGTEYRPDTSHAWLFSFFFSDQVAPLKSHIGYTLAVRSGDVAAVPLPSAVWLFGAGLLGLIGVARRKAA